jgi:hypothetical protein
MIVLGEKSDTYLEKCVNMQGKKLFYEKSSEFH